MPPMRRRCAVLCLLFRAALASCPAYGLPPHCSGHGDCLPTQQCECWPGFQGPDCSQRTCKSGTAWADFATAMDEAHAPAECSNRGLCDRFTGRCACDEGFFGGACDRLRCPGVDGSDAILACSGHGMCSRLRDLARWEYNTRSERFTYEDVWDAEMIYGCICSEGFHGVDCSERTCPTGDDPLTSGQVNEVQIFSCSGSGEFTLMFEGHESAQIGSKFAELQVERALEQMGPNVGNLAVRFSNNASKVCSAETAEDKNVNVVSVEFLTKFGVVSTMVPFRIAKFEGAITVLSVGQDANLAVLRDQGQNFVEAVVATKEDAPCARRGECNSGQGICECYLSNFELYGSSDLYGHPGLRGDCGLPLTDITTCPGETECNGNGLCRGSKTVIEDDATPSPTAAAPEATWHAAAPFSCACSRGYTGGDCAQRVCPRAKAWFAYPSADEFAHDGLEECSGKGTCDKVVGTCNCPWPFTGAACERMACGPFGKDECNGRGTCSSMRQLGQNVKTNQVSTPFIYGDAFPNDGNTWDADRVFGCDCDEGWKGYDCSLRTCPFGDDPDTMGQFNEVQLLSCAAFSGTFTLSFRDAVTTALSHAATAVQVAAALNKLATVKGAKVVFSFGTTFCDLVSLRNVVTVHFDGLHADLPALIVRLSLARGGVVEAQCRSTRRRGPSSQRSTARFWWTLPAKRTLPCGAIPRRRSAPLRFF